MNDEEIYQQLFQLVESRFLCAGCSVNSADCNECKLVGAVKAALHMLAIRLATAEGASWDNQDNERRLIDANALIRRLKAGFDPGDLYTDKDQFIIDCIHLLENTPTTSISDDIIQLKGDCYNAGYKQGLLNAKETGNE